MSQKAKLFVAIIMFIAAGSYAWMKTRQVTPGSVANNGVTEEYGEREFSPEDRQQRFQEMAKEMNLTKEQQKQIEEVREKGDWRNMREDMQKILTPQQQTQMRDRFEKARADRDAARTLRDAKMKKIMGEKDFERYQEKRRERFGGRGRGGSRGGDGNRGAGGNRGGGATSSAPANT